jgi:DNA-nicking Smr family endonuclease
MGRKDSGGFNTPFADLKKQVKAARKAARQEAKAAPPVPQARPPARSGQAPSARSGDATHARGDATPARSADTTPARSADATPARGDADDADLFERWVGGVERLPTRAERVAPRRAPPPKVAPTPDDEDAEVLATLSDLVAGEGHFDVSDTEEYVEGVAPGIDRRLLRRLKRGDFSVQAHLDLHGMIREEARTAVTAFIRSSRQIGRRCVLIVHGRGLGSPGGEPVLKLALVRWLSRGSLGRQVLAFATARPHDGGAGAVYVLLRR